MRGVGECTTFYYQSTLWVDQKMLFNEFHLVNENHPLTRGHNYIYWLYLPISGFVGQSFLACPSINRAQLITVNTLMDVTFLLFSVSSQGASYVILSVQT